MDVGDAFNDNPEWKKGRYWDPLDFARWPYSARFRMGLDAAPGDEFKIHFTLGPEL